MILTVSICQQAVIADLYEPIRQNVEEEPSDELACINGHCLNSVVVGIVSPEKRHLAAIDFENTVITDRYSVGISAEVLKDPFGSVKRRLTIDNPLLMIKVYPELFESVTLPKMTYNAGEDEFAGFVTAFQVCSKLLLEKFRHNAYGNEELLSRRDPAASVMG